MDFATYLSKHQPLIYKTFENSINQGKIAHAYLIKGAQGAPVLNTAKFLAKTLICDHPNPLACDECLSCLRFDEGNYADFVFIDGEKSTIKVVDIEKLSFLFNRSATEKKGKMIYIIHHLENTNKESLNALLKFLEEPASNVYAFLTTANEAKLLETIISRCQVLTLLPTSYLDVKSKAIENGLSQDDAEILSYLYHDVETINQYIEDKNYLLVKDIFFETLNALKESPQKGLYYIQKEGITQIKTKEQARLFFDLLSLAFKDLLNISYQMPVVLESYHALLKSILKHSLDVERIYLEIMLERGKIELNVNIALLIEHIFIFIVKGGNKQ